MVIEWDKVTWYSKIAAVILFVGTFFLGFWLGTMKAEKVYVQVPHIFHRSMLQNNPINTLTQLTVIPSYAVSTSTITLQVPIVGNKVGDMSVVQIHQTSNSYDATYVGTTTVRGTFLFNDFMGEYCFSVINDDSKIVPNSNFCFDSVIQPSDAVSDGKVHSINISGFYETYGPFDRPNVTHLIGIR